MAISVGDAVLKLGVDTKDLDKGLKGIGASIKKHQKAIGIGMVAMGGAILAVGALSVKTYAAMGDEVAKMARKTGISTVTLSELRQAAELSGTSLTGLEKATKRMATAIGDAKSGLAETVRDFDKLGISVEELEGLSPEDAFIKLGLAIGGIVDPIERAEVAQGIFGRAGMDLLPMFDQGIEGLNEMRQSAHDLGTVFDDEAAKQSEVFTDALHDLGEATTGVQMAIADKLIPVLLPLINTVKDAISSFSAWTKEHPALTKVIVIGTAAFGALLVALGGLLLIAPGIIAAGPMIGLAMHAALGPIGLITLAITALIAIGILLWKNWDKVTRFFKDAWTAMKIAVLTNVQRMLASLNLFMGWIPGFGEKIKQAHDKIANMIAAEKIEKDIRRVKYEMAELKDSIEKTTGALTGSDGLIVAQQAEIGELKRQREELEKVKEAREAANAVMDEQIEIFAKWRDEMEYDRSEAGKLNITMGDIYSSLYDMGRPLNLIKEDMDIWGDSIGNVNAALDYLLKQGFDVISHLDKQADAVRGVGDAYRDMGETAEDAYRDMGGAAGEGGRGRPPTPPGYLPLEKRQNIEGVINELRATFPAAMEEAWKATAPAHYKWYPSHVTTALLYAEEGIRKGRNPKAYLGYLAGLGFGLGPQVQGSAIRALGALGFEHGGIATRPVTARIAEKSPEAVIPLDRLGGMLGRGVVNIYWEVDGRTFARIIGQPLVDEIRIRTGARM